MAPVGRIGETVNKGSVSHGPEACRESQCSDASDRPIAKESTVIRRLAAALCTLPLTAGLMLTAPAARAAALDVTCVGTETVAYQPGLLLTTQSAHTSVTGILAPCSSSDSAITSGNYQEDFTTTLSCSTLLAGRSGTRIFSWSNGHSSTFAFNRAINNVAGQTTVTFTGEITSGQFQSDTVIEQVLFVTPSLLECLLPPGLTSLGPGAVLLSIFKP
jgi:hypothetical protein